MNQSIKSDAEVNLSKHQIDIITKAADELMLGEKNKSEALKLMATSEKGQLSNLKDTLSDFPGVVTESIWDSFLKADVAERLKNSPSKDTLVNRLKRATMGLTLAKHEPSFAPQSEHTNLKKYAEWVGVELQKSVDPATGQPRLKSIAKSAAKASSRALPVGQERSRRLRAADRKDADARRIYGRAVTDRPRLVIDQTDTKNVSASIRTLVLSGIGFGASSSRQALARIL